jgi:hypothetical protein
MSKEITPQMLWGAGIVLALVLGFVFWKYVIAPPASTASGTPPPGAMERARGNASMREMRLHGQLPNRKPATP